MATAIDTMMRGIYYSSSVNNPCGMSSLARHIGKIGGASLSFPFSPSSLIDVIHKKLKNPVESVEEQLHHLHNVIPITGNMDNKFPPCFQAVTVRGVSNNFAKEEFQARKQELHAQSNFQSVSTVEDLFNYYFTLTSPSNILWSYEEKPVRIPPAFPHNDYSKTFECELTQAEGERLRSAPILSHLQSGKNLQPTLRRMVSSIQKRAGVEIGLSSDDISATLNYMQDLIDEN